MKFLIVLATLAVCAYAQSVNLNPAGCGRRNTSGKRDSDKIVGGSRAQIGDWGWQVSLQYFGRHICGGSLINNQWILTAAHCVDGNTSPSYWTIGLGMNDLNNPNSWSQKVSVSKVIMNPTYDSRQLTNDIALIKLSSPVTFNNNLLPVCFPTSNTVPSLAQGTTTWATGWGTLFSGGSVSQYLMQVDMPTLSDAQCKTKYSIVNTPSGFCAGVDGANKDTCQGDSGGPLVVQSSTGQYYVVGITSYGYGCGDGGVYTRSSYYYNWVSTTIRSN